MDLSSVNSPVSLDALLLNDSTLFIAEVTKYFERYEATDSEDEPP